MLCIKGTKLRIFVLAVALTLQFAGADFSIAQNADSLGERKWYVVDSIIISGNTITDEDIIIKELPFSVKDTVYKRVLQFSEERIFSLGIFNNVKINLSGPDTAAVCHIHVEESWYIYPLPFLDLKEGDWKKLSYGLNILIKNFRGRNEDLSLSFGLGYDPFYSVTYHKPYLIREENISFYFSSQYANLSNKSLQAEQLTAADFTYRYFMLSVGVGKRFSLFNRVDLFTNYLHVRSDYSIKGVTGSGNQNDNIPSVAVSFTHDSRDLRQFPDSGLFFNASAQSSGFGVNEINYLTYKTDFRYYQYIYGDLSGKIRLYQRSLYGKNIPLYDYSFLGLDDKIRGFYTKRTEGRQLYLASIETKFPIIGMTNLQFDFPIIPRQLQGFRTAVYLTFFVDGGITVDNNEHITMENLLTGYGAGITILALPYNLARFEYAINKFGKNELILSLGVTF